MSRIEVAAELCKSCELCIAVCPKDCIEHPGTLDRYGVYPMRMREGRGVHRLLAVRRHVPGRRDRSLSEQWSGGDLRSKARSAAK